MSDLLWTPTIWDDARQEYVPNPMPNPNVAPKEKDMSKSKLYHVQYDNQSYWVEGNSFAHAISLWKDHVAEEWGSDYDGSEEPESVQLVHDDPVIRVKR